MPRMMSAVRRWVKICPWYYARDESGRGAQRAREEREWRREERPDYARIAVLEHEELGITPEPGTREAHAVAAATPVDQAACPHEDVIDTSEWGQARRHGMCARCGAAMLENDQGEWQRP